MELLRSTAPPAEPEPADDAAPVDEEETEGRGGAADAPVASPRPRARRKATNPSKTKARNIRLSDDVHDRLWLLARQRRQTVSAVADELLNKALPRWELKRQG
jgi:hypothetical protein